MRIDGVVKRLLKEKGFGFVSGPDGDVFVHRSSGETETFDSLEEGDLVSYEQEEGPKGLRARNLQRR